VTIRCVDLFSFPTPVVSTLACGLSSGDVTLINVTQTLPSGKGAQGSSSALEVTVVTRNEKAGSSNKRIITAMKWVSKQDGTVSGIALVP
jgi:hypothetical protein